MKNANYNKHLSLSDRQIIETAVNNGSTKSAIAKILGKDPSTIGKEIKAHRVLTHTFSLPLECDNYRDCKHNRNCKKDCIDYKPFKCTRRDRSPGCCNGCSNMQHCRFDKYRYEASTSHREYRNDLVNSREGFNISQEEVKRIGNILLPLIKNGQSIEQVLLSHPEINVTCKTIYTYIEANLFKVNGINLTVMDLRRQVSRKIPKKKVNLYKEREDKSFLKGRTYKDYENYISDNPYAKVVQMDTVYNSITNGPFIQTFKFIKYGFLFCIYHTEKTKEAMNNGILLLEEILGEELFNKEVEVLLTDRGSEFYGAYQLEIREDSTRRTRVFYCDPMASHQKGSLENKHEELRYICPKEVNLYSLGLTSQEKMNLVMSHVNSCPRKKLDGKSPIELIKFYSPELVKKLFDFGINEIDKDKIILKPYLLKH